MGENSLPTQNLISTRNQHEFYTLVSVLETQQRRHVPFLPIQPAMTKASETVIYAIALTSIYFILYLGIIPTSTLFQEEVLPVVPFWSLVTFGCYALFSLGYGVYTLQDKEDKYVELKEQIGEAKVFLKSKGVDC